MCAMILILLSTWHPVEAVPQYTTPCSLGLRWESAGSRQRGGGRSGGSDLPRMLAKHIRENGFDGGAFIIIALIIGECVLVAWLERDKPTRDSDQLANTGPVPPAASDATDYDALADLPRPLPQDYGP